MTLRPLRNAHWSLPTFVIGSWLLLVYSKPCAEPPHYADVVVLTASAMLIVWTHHLALAPILSWRQACRLAMAVAGDFARLIMFFVLLAIPLAVVMPAYQCYTPRAKAAEVLLAGAALRTQVDDRAAKTGSLEGSGEGLAIPAAGRVATGFASRNGEITVIGVDPAVVFILTPSLQAGTVTWACRGFPKELAPMMCRNP